MTKNPYTATAELSDSAILLEFELIVAIKEFCKETLLCSWARLIKAAEMIFFLRKKVHLLMRSASLRNRTLNFGKVHRFYSG